MRFAGRVSRAVCLTLFVLLLIPSHAARAENENAEQPGDDLQLNDMRTPVAPGFTILGVAPTLVEKPKSPKAVAISALSSLRDENRFPKDYALEFSPWGLKPKKGVAFNKYYGGSPIYTAMRTAAISVATAAMGTEDTTTGTSMGLGVRMLLFEGRPNDTVQRVRSEVKLSMLNALAVSDAFDELEEDAERSRVADFLDLYAQTYSAYESLNKALAKRRSADMELVESLVRTEMGMSDNDTFTGADLTKLEGHLDDQRRELIMNARAQSTAPVGFIMEFAGAVALDFANDDVDSAEVGRWGIWATPYYRIASGQLDLIGVVRYHEDRRTDRSYLDLGGRFGWQGTSRFAVFAEALLRDDLSTSRESVHRITGNIDYRIEEDLYFSASFGKDFDEEETGKDPLVAIFGINFGFGSNPTVDLK